MKRPIVSAIIAVFMWIQPHDSARAAGPSAGPSSGTSSGPSSASSQATVPAGVEQRGSRRVIRLPEVPAELPAGPGREAAVTACGMCHTPAYITLQPAFSRDVWIAEVAKMRKTFSAPISDEKAQEIVNYLVAVRGPKGK